MRLLAGAVRNAANVASWWCRPSSTHNWLHLHPAIIVCAHRPGRLVSNICASTIEALLKSQ